MCTKYINCARTRRWKTRWTWKISWREKWPPRKKNNWSRWRWTTSTRTRIPCAKSSRCQRTSRSKVCRLRLYTRVIIIIRLFVRRNFARLVCVVTGTARRDRTPRNIFMFSNRPRAEVFVQLLERSVDGTNGRAVAEETSDRPGVEHSRSSGADAHFHDTSFRTEKPPVARKYTSCVIVR